MLNDMFPFHFDENLPHAPENARLNPLQLNTVWFGVPPSLGVTVDRLPVASFVMLSGRDGTNEV
jgi:hypothetical protein